MSLEAGELEVFVYKFEDGKKFCVGGKVELSEVEKKSIEIPQDVALAVIAEHDKIVEEHKKKMAEEENQEPVDENDLTDEELKIMRDKFGFD